MANIVLDLFFLLGEEALHCIILQMVRLNEEAILNCDETDLLTYFKRGMIKDSFHVFKLDQRKALTLEDFTLNFMRVSQNWVSDLITTLFIPIIKILKFFSQAIVELSTIDAKDFGRYLNQIIFFIILMHIRVLIFFAVLASIPQGEAKQRQVAHYFSDKRDTVLLVLEKLSITPSRSLCT